MSRRSGRFVKWLYAFIPLHVGNGVIIAMMQLMRFLGRHGGMYAASHSELNESNLGRLSVDDYAGPGHYMEKQRALDDLYLGMSTMDKAGCEVIAVYNALTALGIRGYTIPGLIEDFEKDGIMRSGRFGVSVRAMYDKLKSIGLKPHLTVKKDKMKELLDRSSTAILTLYNDRTTIGEQIHSVCITRDGGYYIHNMYGDGSVLGPYEDMDDIVGRLRNGLTAPIALIGIDCK